MASSVTHHLTPSLRQRHQFGNNNNGTTKALRRSGVPTAGRRVSSTSPMAFFIPNLIPNPNYRWGECKANTTNQASRDAFSFLGAFTRLDVTNSA